jgi:hypothetical protein
MIGRDYVLPMASEAAGGGPCSSAFTPYAFGAKLEDLLSVFNQFANPCISIACASLDAVEGTTPIMGGSPQTSKASLGSVKR